MDEEHGNNSNQCTSFMPFSCRAISNGGSHSQLQTQRGGNGGLRQSGNHNEYKKLEVSEDFLLMLQFMELAKKFNEIVHIRCHDFYVNPCLKQGLLATQTEQTHFS